ncbi:amidase [Xanthobacter dioxanivorans]|uniref:Amidase n=1 Tax=Xanthobacter dioxanivorans TaxID=2528964 RepID=A0A974PSV2_9HYPH|nr:amidase family protein [Xanthobacter dioxanivorans]QRG09137.1 amidase [Xanthobacter dioxanivorans]
MSEARVSASLRLASDDFQDIRPRFADVRAALAEGADPVGLALKAADRAAAAAAEGIFTALIPRESVAASARAAAGRARAGEDLPLLGLTFSVKDNVHVAGMATTCNCPAFSVMPGESALVVTRLEAAGAVLIGKNTMDQFATGLNGTRTPEPLCRNALDPAFIPGGSSSGSAVAVARGIVSFALGSDTGGSGRVPAACNGIVGVKPTVGLVSNRGVIYNSRLLDCVPVFAACVTEANEILRAIAGFDPGDAWSRRDADAIEVTIQDPAGARLAVPRASQMRFFGDDAAETAFAANLARLRTLGFVLEEIDFSPFEEAGRLVFQSALVAERLVDYGDVIIQDRDRIHPAVLAAIEPGLSYSAKDAFEVVYRIKELKRAAELALDGYAALVVPTIPTIFTIEEMLAEPLARNTVMGTYTYFVNPMDLCAVSVPGAPARAGLPSALSFIGLAGKDGVVAGLARSFAAERA